MRQMNKILVLFAVLLIGQYAVAQPPARKKEQKKSGATTAATYEVPLSERAKSQYPTTTTPTEVVWKRDIYRTLDLEKEKNASLYYPVQPIGNSVNLFTFLFRHLIAGSINAYEYNLDGYENFSPENIVNVRELLEHYAIVHEFQGADSTIVVNPADVPSNVVLSYYIKESYYYDQRTATFSQRVTAICPVMHNAGEYGGETIKYPMFWLKYDEIAPLLTQQTVMSSSYNNVSTMTFDDFFTKHCYEGDIYKTVNLRNLAIAQYCKDSTAIKKEQQKIEKQLADVQGTLWELPRPAADTTAVAADSVATDTKQKAKGEKREARAARKKQQSASKKKSSGGSSKSKGSTISVRRQRR
ncbi:MAG: gliding motility protein GldN [Bacteroidaceae bacterium]|nr:gliding motility protein GldN [Bacteroidaceae bacterium]